MQIGMIGLGRMGSNMVLRLLRAGHQCIVYARNPDSMAGLVAEGAIGASDLADFCAKLETPRHLWIMIPAGAVDSVIEGLLPHLSPGDTLIDGGNSHYREDLVRAERLALEGIHYVDCGTSGGVWGLERGYCLMIGGETQVVERLDPIFASLAPGADSIERTAGRSGPVSRSEMGYLHCGPNGAGHFVKMVHNGIEYALMGAYAEGLNLLKHAGAGRQDRATDAETAPLSHPEHYQYDLDLAEVTEVWRRGSVVASWLLDLTANALAEDPELKGFSGRVSDSGEGRWTCLAAIETGTPAPLLTTALYERFSSRGEGDFANQILSAMRYQFGGHHEKPAD
ncbi:phosphogluconate dehydrogenase (NAD(+)-dependent, decarboxylating) [Thiocystis violascens]|uniref:6-phosphogluconate dehydrogenase, decarboxylating n=1 Tax=Thiocystis violascens (strain ATCC 17096 / DSM 198 / 6111) TaxID=765911 RepID=I3YHE8_THIV6|nr:decarboxylating 6-phosphogluconate dehydrogenase [Thiocystis violascens]AFL76416.1 6-phosphogluconate dehydrogenase, decarboxylating [Thiocystis violascens DSM 198]